MATPIFKTYQSRARPWTPGSIPSNQRMFWDELTGSPVGMESPSSSGPQGIWTPNDVTAEEIASPPSEMLADLNSTFRLNVPPYTRYRSTGTELVTLDGDGPVIATGSTASRSLSDRFADILNVKDFGAGSGNDDTAAFAAAVTAVCSGSYGPPRLYVPAAEYNITSAISPTLRYYAMYGDGPQQSIINFTNEAFRAPVLSEFSTHISGLAFIGGASSGIALNLAPSLIVDLSTFENLVIWAGEQAIYQPYDVFSSTFRSIFGNSYNNHVFHTSHGPSVTWLDCYAGTAGPGKGGYRQAGIICRIGCNGVNEAAYGAVDGSLMSASNGFEDDFPFDDYPVEHNINCNFENFGTGVGGTDGSGIRLVNAARLFILDGGKIQGPDTDYHSAIRLDQGTNGGIDVRLNPGWWSLGNGTRVADIWTEFDTGVVDVSSVLALAGSPTPTTTYFVNQTSSTLPITRGASSTFAAGLTVTGANGNDVAATVTIQTGKAFATVKAGTGPTWTFGPNIGLGTGDIGFGLVNGSANYWYCLTGTFNVVSDLAHAGTNLGFYGTSPTTKPTITGSRGGNAAVASIATALAALGLVVDSTS